MPPIVPNAVPTASEADVARVAPKGGHRNARDASLATEIVSTDAGLAALRDEWTELIMASKANTLFLTWEWVTTWWRVYHHGQLHVVLVRDARGLLVGLAPLHLVRRDALGTTWNAVAFLGDGGDVTPEHLDFVVREGCAATVTAAILDGLLSNPLIAEIDLQPFATHSSSLTLVIAKMKHAGGITNRRPGPRCPYALLPHSREEFLAGRSRNYRKKIGEYERRCQRKYATRLRRSATATEVTRDLESLRTLHLARWGQSSRAFRTAEYLDFHEQFAQLMLQGEHLRLYSMEAGADGRPLAMSYCVNYAGRYYFYQAGRDPSTEGERTGLVLMHQVIQEAIADGATVFDFLSGQEPYKYRWASGETGSCRVTHWKHASTYAVAMGQRAVSALLSMPGRFGRKWLLS